MATLGKRKVDSVTEEGVFYNDRLMQGTKTYPSGLSASGFFNHDGSLKRGRFVTKEYVSYGTCENGFIKNGVTVYGDDDVKHGRFNHEEFKEGTIIKGLNDLDHGVFKNNKLYHGTLIKDSTIKHGHFDNDHLSSGTIIEDGIVKVGSHKDNDFKGVYVNHDTNGVKEVNVGKFTDHVLTYGLNYTTENRFFIKTRDNDIKRYPNTLEMGTFDDKRTLIRGTTVFDDGLMQVGQYENNHLVEGIEINQNTNEMVACIKDSPKDLFFNIKYENNSWVINLEKQKKRIIISDNAVVVECDEFAKANVKVENTEELEVD